MPKTQLSAEQLSDYLDNALPANSNRVNHQDDAPALVHVAQLMTDDTVYQLSDVGRQMMHDHILSEVSTLRSKGHYRRIIPFGSGVIRLVAGIVILFFISVSILASQPGQPLYAVKSALGLADLDNDDNIVITTLPVDETETLTPTTTSSPTNTLAPTETELPITTVTEASVDQGIIATPESGFDVTAVDAQLWYVTAVSGAIVRAEPSLTADELTTLNNGNAVVVMGYSADGEWAQILLNSGELGWISNNLLADAPPPPQPPATQQNTNNGGNGNGGQQPPPATPQPDNNGGGGNNNNGGGNNNNGGQPRPTRDPNRPPPPANGN